MLELDFCPVEPWFIDEEPAAPIDEVEEGWFEAVEELAGRVCFEDAEEAPLAAEACLPWIPGAASVSSSRLPVCFRPWAFWNSRSALLVFEPIWPSAEPAL